MVICVDNLTTQMGRKFVTKVVDTSRMKISGLFYDNKNFVLKVRAEI